MISGSKSRDKLLLQSSFYGAIRGLISLPFEHPFESIKTRAQNSLSFRSSVDVIKEMYQVFGVRKGIYAGFIPNSIRVTIKHFYRTPLMLFLPLKFETILPKQIKKISPCSHKTAAGGAIALIETFIICPLERIKVIFMTRNNDLKHTQLFDDGKKGFVKELFTGLKATFLRQMVAWTSFLYFDFKYKSIFRNYRGMELSHPLSFQDLSVVSVLTGISNVAVGIFTFYSVLPIDKVKTLYQMHQNSSYSNSKLLPLFKKVYLEGGFHSFYSGWQARLAQYIFQALITCSMIDHFEAKLKREH